MRFSNQKLPHLTDNAKKKKNSPVKKAVITGVIIAAFAFQSNPIAMAESPKHTPDYNKTPAHTYVSFVSNNNVLNTLRNDKQESAGLPYQTMNLQLGTHLNYNLEDVVYRTSYGQMTMHNLQNMLQLKTEAAAIVIDGKPIVYLENKNAAEDVIRKLELHYVTEGQLKEFEKRSISANSNQNETHILDIHFSKNISIETIHVDPRIILTADRAVYLLQRGTLGETKYMVHAGDVLGTIANSHQLGIADVLALNPGLTENSVLKIGKEINLTMTKPYIDVVVEKAVTQQETIPYPIETSNDPSLPKGETKVSLAGQAGLQKVSYHITVQNGKTVKKVRLMQTVLKQPIKQIVIKGTKAVSSHGDGTLEWPTVGGYISSSFGSRWGKMHKGIDIAGPASLTIKAADNGVVVFAGWDNGGYGNKIIIDHQDGYRTVYAHLSSISVHTGQNVEKGSAIGVMGETGDATGVHLHFEVYKNGALQNPSMYVRR